MSVRDKVSDDSDVVRPLSAAVGYTSVVWFASLVHCEATCASDRVSGAPSGFWARPKSAEDVHWGARWRRNSSSVVSPFLSSNDRLAGESLKGAWGHDGLQRSSRARDRSHRRARVNRLAWDHATAFVLRPRRRTRKRARVDRGKPSLSYPRRARTRSDATPGRLARFRSSPLSRKSRSDVGSRSVRLRFGRRSPEFLWRSARSSRWATGSAAARPRRPT